MERYIALLRGINVSGQKKILMADLRELLEGVGLEDVQTYIQSGNVVFSATESRGQAKVISEAIKKKYGWEVPVLVITTSGIEKILSNCPFSEEKMEQSYFTLFQEPPLEENVKVIENMNFPGEEYHITPACMYFFCEAGYARVKMTGNFVERKLKVRTTTRNYRTMVKLSELATQD